MKFPGRESSKITWNTKGSRWVGKKPAAPSRCLWPITAYQQLMAQRGIKGGLGGHPKKVLQRRMVGMEHWDSDLRSWVWILGAAEGQAVDLIPSDLGCSMVR